MAISKHFVIDAILLITSIVQLYLIKLGKGKAPRKHNLHGKISASV